MGLGTAHVWHSLTYSPKISFSVKTQNIGQKYSTLLPVFPRRLNLRWVEMRPANDIPCGRTTSPRMDRSDRTWYILNHKVFLAISQWPTVYSRPLQNAREPYNTFTVSSCIQACFCGAMRPDGQIVSQWTQACKLSTGVAAQPISSHPKYWSMPPATTDAGTNF